MMKFFLHTTQQVRLINEDQDATFTPAEFAALEPNYPGLMGAWQFLFDGKSPTLITKGD